MSTYLGQNFLIDEFLTGKIVSTIGDMLSKTQAKTLVEIGPGRGALTKKILQLPEKLICIEKDTTMQYYLQPLLKKNAHMSVIYQDVLEHTPASIFPSISLVVGNLPYYITSPILRKFFGVTQKTYLGGVFLIQKEVAEKISHNATKKSFLRWLINYAYHVEYCFSVPPEAFDPPPKVTSAVISILPKDKSVVPSLSYDQMIVFLDQYSSFKRKTLGSSQKIVNKLAKKNNPDQDVFDISPFSGQRLEELSWDDMKYIIESCKI